MGILRTILHIFTLGIVDSSEEYERKTSRRTGVNISEETSIRLCRLDPVLNNGKK